MGSKSNQGAPSTSQVNTGPWSAQAPYLQDAFSQAQSNYNTAKNNTYYTGEAVAPLNAAQNTALGNTISMGNSTNPNVAAAGTQNLDTINGDYLDPATDPYLTGTYNAAAQAVTNQYQTATAPQTAGAMEAAGRYGSGSYGNQVQQNQLNLGTSLGNLAQNIYGQNYQNERANQTAATAEAPALNQAQYINPTAALTAGNQQQTQQQNVDVNAMNAYNYNRDQPTNALNNYIGQIQGNYGQNGTTTTSTPYYTNPGATGLGAALGLGSLATPGASGTSALGNLGSIFSKSDRRVKENIVHVGTSNNGQPLYLFNYIGDATPHVGLMAQEVEKFRPEAVITGEDGIKRVNYALALL